MRTRLAPVRSRKRLRDTITLDEWLCVEGIEFECIIGVTDRERSIKQKVVVTLRIHADFDAVKRTDAIQDTVDYRAICRTVIAAGEKSSAQLIERLAGYLGRTLLAEFPRIGAVRVELWKPGALSAANAVGVVVTETRA